MKYLMFILLGASMTVANTIFDFNLNTNLSNWTIIDDGVMGGQSAGNFELSPEGHGNFYGEVSLKNNGGFSSLHYKFSRKTVEAFSKVILKIKGDGKPYQFRIRANASDYYSYVKRFETTGEWQSVSIDLNDMYPTFRGRKLDQPNFNINYIEEVAFLIGNKKQETFQLLIDKIELK